MKVVAVVSAASLDDGGDRLLRIVSSCASAGAVVSLVAATSGPALDAYTRAAPTAVFDQGTRWSDAVDRIGSTSLSSWRSNRRLRSILARADAVLTLPSALDLVSRTVAGTGGRVNPPTVVVVAPPGLSLPDDCTSWSPSGAELCVVASPIAAAQCSGTRDVEYIPVPGLVGHPAGAGINRTTRRHGPIVIVASPDLWCRVDHSTEVLWALSAQLPEQRFTLVADAADRWMCDLDLVHCGIESRVDVVDRADVVHRPELLRRAAAVVRCGYASADVPIMVEAAAAGVGLVVFRSGDLPVRAVVCTPFDVDDAVRQTLDIVGAASLQGPRLPLPGPTSTMAPDVAGLLSAVAQRRAR